MIPTIEFMKKYFPIFNKRFFENKLKEPVFEIEHKKTHLGEFQQCIDLSPHGNELSIDVIRMTDYYQLEEQTALEVLIHEMIHLWTNQTPDPSCPDRHLPVDHGKWFKMKAAEINGISKFHISVTCDGTTLVKASKKDKQKKN